MPVNEIFMRIGLDFDNTIACYDSAIAKLAEEMFDLPDIVPRTKIGVRDYLRIKDREIEWTAFQGSSMAQGCDMHKLMKAPLILCFS